MKFFLVASLSFCTGFFSMKAFLGNPIRTDLPAFERKTIQLPSLMPAIVRLHDKKSGEFFCSGTVISDRYILTAAHCVEGRDRITETIEVRSNDQKPTKIYAAAAFYEGRSDQALLLGDFTGFNGLTMLLSPYAGLEAFMSQEKLMFMCGQPYGDKLFCSPFTQRRQSFFSIAGRGFLFPGMSGGPVIDKDSGLVVGINYAATDGEVLVSPLIGLFANARVEVIP